MTESLINSSLYVVNNLNAILYGVEPTLCFMILRQLAHTRRPTNQDKFLVTFSTQLLILNTVYWATQSYFGQELCTVHADYPGGGNADLQDNAAVWYLTWGSATLMISQLMAGILMMFRLALIWDKDSITTAPAILWFGSFGSCLGLLYESGSPHGNPLAGNATKFGVAWNLFTFSFNVIVTTLICGRIIYTRRRLSRMDEESKAYIAAVAISVESALPLTLGNLAFIMAYVMGSDVAIAFSWYSMFTAISPQLIVHRILTRQAWHKDTRSKPPVEQKQLLASDESHEQ
ncbi:hypothetical protein OH77DRAFT_1409351 [Trametes cingulata]|nr:hypothetical protein OH77DRAFT_1409351 [Trametes cingulata]